MAHSGQNRRKHAPVRNSFRTLEQLEARLLLSVNTLVKSSAPAVPKITLMPATTVSGSQSILSSSNISGSTTSVSVVSSAGDSAAYGYRWTVVQSPVGGSMSFAKNSSNLAKVNTLTFKAAGTYLVSVTATNGSKIISAGTLKFTVEQKLSGIGVKTGDGTAVTTKVLTTNGTTLQLAATGLDQFGAPMLNQPAVSWQFLTQPAGPTASIVTSGNTATANFRSAGAYTVRAQSGSFRFDTPIAIAQTLTSFTMTTPDNSPVESEQTLSVTTKNLRLNFNAYDQFGKTMSTLPKITWKTTQAPEGGRASASASGGILNVTFSAPGIYATEALIAGQTFRFTSDVVSTFSAIQVLTPEDQKLGTGFVVVKGTSQHLSAIAVDQFGVALPDQPAIAWETTATPVGGTATLTPDSSGTNIDFDRAGRYTIRASSGDVVFNAQLNVTPILISIGLRQTDNSPVDPDQPIIISTASQQLIVYGLDQFGNALAPTGIQWTTTSAPVGGSVTTRLSSATATIVFTKTGDYSIVAQSGALTCNASFQVVQGLRSVIVTGANNQTLANAATVTTNASSAFLTAIGLDQFGATMLEQPSFTWSFVTAPSGSQPTIDTSNNEATFNFNKAGAYSVRATSGSVVFNLKFNVGQAATSLAVTPGNLAIASKAKQQFTAKALDQFGLPLTQQPSFTWTTNGGTISSTGLFTAGNSTGTFSISVRAGALSATVSVEVTVPPTPSGLHDPGLISLVATFYADQTIDRSEMIQLLRSAGEDGSVSATELADFRFLVSPTTSFDIPDYVRVLASDVVTANPANLKFQGNTAGNLASGSSATLLNNLVDKWFLGADVPLISTSGVTYQTSTGNLFNGTPSRLDAKQGQLGDCYFIAAIAGIADRNPNAIRDMFIDNGDSTYTIRFYSVGSGAPTADYVTVDRRLPAYSNRTLAYSGNGKSVTSTSTTLWIALAEKAYTQWNETGKAGRDGTNRYSAIEGGWMSNVNAPVLGYQSTNYSLSSQQTLINSLTANQAVTIGTKTGVTAGGLYGSHAYIVTGYTASTGTFTLFNPWGTSHPTPLRWAQLQANCSMFVVTNTTSLPGTASSAVRATVPTAQTTTITTSITSHTSIANLISGFDAATSSDSASHMSSDSGITDIADNKAVAEESLATESLLNELHGPSEFSSEASVTMLHPELLDLAILDLDLSVL